MSDLQEIKLKQLGKRLRYFRKSKGYSNYEHSSAKTKQTYTHMSSKDLKNIISPLEKLRLV